MGCVSLMLGVCMCVILLWMLCNVGSVGFVLSL